MNLKLLRLAEQRNLLIARAAAQRLELAQNIEPWRTPLARVDQGLHVLKLIKSHPVWLVGGSALLATLKFARTGKWLRRGWVAWQIMRVLRNRS